MMKILFEFTESAKHHSNEDRYGFNKNIAWVLDGLTEVFFNKQISKENDVVWFVEEMNNELKKANTERSLHDIIYTAISNVYQKASSINPEIKNYKPYQLPSATIALIRINDESIDYFLLGDCSIITEEGNILTDYRLEPFHKLLVSKKQEYQGSEGYKEIIINEVKKMRKTINTDEGYWVLGLDTEAVSHALFGTILVRNKAGYKVLCCSDGFYPAIHEHCGALFSLKNCFDKNQLWKMIKNQRQIEEKKEQQENRVLRDDLTVLVICN